MQKFDFLIIGAGIVGLSTAYKLLKKDSSLNVVVLDKEPKIASHQTGNNSGVIHSGLYYKPGSLKAKNCRKGRDELIDFCNSFDIPVEKCGKIIVATNEKELPRLYDLEKRGNANKVEGLEIISKEEAREIEPNVNVIKAIKVPNASIVDYKEVCKKLKQEIERLGGQILLNEKVLKIVPEQSSIKVITKKSEYITKNLINCAGLHSDRIAKMAKPKRKIKLKIIPFRGEYYDLKEEKKDLIKGLIYPVPDPKFPFLGVHLTKMIDGSVEAGPNAVFAFAREGYKKTNINIKDCLDSFLYPGFLVVAVKYWKMGLFEMYRSFSKKAFLKSLQKLVPSLQMDDIVTGNAGIRAQAIDSRGKLLDDFAIIKEKNQVHVLNAPSPAATAGLAVGEYVANLALDK